MDGTISLTLTAARQLVGYTVSFAPGTQFSYLAGNISAKDVWTHQMPNPTDFTPAVIDEVGELDGKWYARVRQEGPMGNDYYVWSNMNDGVFISDLVEDENGEQFSITPSQPAPSGASANVTEKMKSVVVMNPLFAGAVILLMLGTIIYLATGKKAA